MNSLSIWMQKLALKVKYDFLVLPIFLLAYSRQYCQILFLLMCFKYLTAHCFFWLCETNEGHGVVRGNCVACREHYYQDVERASVPCKPCTICAKNTGSTIEQECTKMTDRKCKCREGFVSREKDHSICKCNSGFEQKDGVCSECADGHFSYGTGACQRWKDCKTAGVKVEGTKTSDVICNDERNSNVPNPPPHTYTTVDSLSRLTAYRPSEGAPTQKMQTTTSTAATPLATLRGKEQPSNTGNHIGIALLMLGIIGLVALTALTCKLNITPCWVKKTAVPKQDSFCGRPVEESGDDSSSSLKLNPGEP
uniref:TNFR-Cys domain-containing protein n=1 Tax=Acanthochromis polyacanthus TaxID=80966 RepID=A0A3Q1HUS5_9TELE